jgi:hypothetical protein
VDCYLSYFRQRLITLLLSALLSFQPLFTESSCEDQLLTPPPFSSTLSATPPPLLCVSFQFLVYCSVFCFYFFCRWGGQSAHGAMLVSPRGGWRNTAGCLVLSCWSAGCLPGRFGASGWQCRQPYCFLSVTWHGEAFYGLGVQGVEVLILLGALFLPSLTC